MSVAKTVAEKHISAMLDPVAPLAVDFQSPFLRVALASLGYVRDLVRLTADDGDLVEALAFTTALDANMVPVDRDADLAVAYGRLDESAPDELRRPVSINSVAQSLGLPFETVRRRFVSLTDRGLCISTPAGVIIPRSAVTSSVYNGIQQARYERTRSFFLSLRADGILGPPEAAHEAADDPLVRATNRIVSEYALRICPALVGLTGNVLSSLVMLELILENIADLDDRRRRSWLKDPARHGAPRRIVDLTRGLPLSRETVRRHLQLLEEAGLCRRGPSGFVAAPGPRAAPQMIQLAQANEADLRRMMGRLERLGILARWERGGAHDMSNAAFASGAPARH